MASLFSWDAGEKFMRPSPFQLEAAHVSFSAAWFFPLALVVVIMASAIFRLTSKQRAFDKKSELLAAAPVVAASPTVRPRHMAVIMDGNRRYGREKHGVPTKGHWDGGNTLIDFVKWCISARIPAVTVYAFSSENWSRPQHEIDVLMQIFVRYCDRIEDESRKNGIQVRFISTSPQLFKPKVLERFRRVEEASKHCSNLVLNVCVSYGAREELALACQHIAERVNCGEMTCDQITPDELSKSLLTSHVPDPDLVLRTSGEQRLSNFLLFQAAYAEFVFVDKYWPALTREDFDEVLDEFARRKRRFGK